jgi:hypothetical protein
LLGQFLVIYKWKAVPFLSRFILRKCIPVDFIGKPIIEALVSFFAPF